MVEAQGLHSGCKLFVNIGWDKNVPPPPDATEAAIEDAMLGRGESYYVPVIISDIRDDFDKGISQHFSVINSVHPSRPGGKRALVIDAIYHTSLKQRSLTNPNFKTFLIRTFTSVRGTILSDCAFVLSL